MVIGSEPQEDDPSDDIESDSEETFGGGMFRFASSGGSFANRCIRSWFMALAFSSVKPGLRSPLTVEEKDDSSLVARWAWQNGHSVSSVLAWTG